MPQPGSSLEIHDAPGGIAEAWDQLADVSGASPFLRPGWIGAWWTAFGKGSLRILTLRDDDSLLAVLPLAARRGVLQSPTNWHTPIFGAVAADRDEAFALAEAAFAQRMHRLQISFVADPTAELVPFKRAGAEAGYRLLERVVQRSPYVPISGDWNDYEQRLTSKRRSNLRRMRRRLEAQGELALEVLDGGDRLDELLEEGFDIESRGWKGSRGSAILSRKETAQFYREVASWAARRGSLRLAFLRLSGRPLAFDYSLEENGVHYLLKTGFDPDYRSFAPGVLIREDMLARAFSLGLTAYEFLGTDAPWKREWTDSYRERWLLQAFAPSPLGAVEHVAFARGRPLVKQVLGALGR